jgi:IMP dehydrogenase
VGVGGGSFCSTRVETGIGFPQLDAVRLIAYVARRHGVPVISDGAIRMPGHVVIAQVAGASSVMAAGIYDQCKELPHRTPEGKIITRGMASNGLRGQFRQVDPLKASEGVAKIKDPLYSIEQVFDRYEGAIRSALSQLGVFSIEDAYRFGRLILVEASTNTENQPTPVGIIGS